MQFDDVIAMLELTDDVDIAAAKVIYRFGRECGAASRADMPLPPKPDDAVIGIDTAEVRNGILFAHCASAGFDAEFPKSERGIPVYQ